MASITCFITLTSHTCLPRLNALTAGSNVTWRMRSTFTTANRGRVAPFHYHFRTDSSARTDSAIPSRAVVSPAYQIYPFSSGQCENSQPLPVPDWMMIVILLRSAQWLTATWCIIGEEMASNIPESRRSIIREGVPTPMPILEELAPKG